MQIKILAAFAISLAVTALLMIPCNPIYGGGKTLLNKQLDRSGDTIADEAGRTVKNTKGEVEHATKDVIEESARAVKDAKSESTRAPKNIADFLIGKNDSDKQLIKNVQGGLQQAGKNAQGAVNQIDQNFIGFNKAWNATFNKGMDSIFPSAPSIYNQFKPGVKAVGDEVGRAEKNIKQNTDRAISDTANEAARAPKNVADFLTGKNDSDQQLIKNINAGVVKIEQVGDEFRNPITRTGEQIKRSGEDIANEAGRAGKNIGAVVGDTANEVKAEAQRAPQNAVNFLTGKNDSIKNTVDTVSAGLDQLGKNIQAGGDAWQRINCGANCYSIFPTSSVLGNALLKAGKDINAEANRAIDRIGTGKDLGRDISRTADKAGGDITKAADKAGTDVSNAATTAANQAGNTANDAADAVAGVMGW